MNNKDLFKYCFGYESDSLPETAIITPFIRTELFQEHCKVIDIFRGKIYSGVKASKNGKEFSIISCGIGSGVSGDAAVLLAGSKVRKMVFLGACGGFGDCEIGDIVVGKRAFNGEGFSRYHDGTHDLKDVRDTKNIIDCSEGYTIALEDLLCKKKESFKTGDIYTIGSMTAENKDLLTRIEKGGFKAIEMELSAVYNGARNNGAEAAGLLSVSDLPLKKPIWETAVSDEDRKKILGSMKKIVKIAVEFVSGV
ncbi:MAG: hypothetical protein ABH862_06020 [Candidatus Omnitrophota bacterium]